MEQRRLAGAVAEGEHRRHLLGGGSFGVAAQPRLVGDPHIRPQHQRVEVLAEELPVADPDVARLERLERPDVDEHRPGADELHVVRRRVLQDHVLRQGGLEDVELQECGVPQHRERPLVWVGDDRDPPVVEHPGPPTRRRSRRCRDAGGRLGVDHVAPDQLLAEEAGAGQRLPGVEVSLVERPVDLPVHGEDPVARVAERPRVDSGSRTRRDARRGWPRVFRR